MPASMTQILNSGPPGEKFNIAVLGDGFTESEQAAYNAKVQELLIDGMFRNDYFHEDMSAFNIYRINLISAESGISTRDYDLKDKSDPKDDTIIKETILDTALGYIYNGVWERRWIENGANTETLLYNALDQWVPDRHLALILLNTPSFGGVGGGGVQIVTLGVSWGGIAHEFGHGFGGLSDEYCELPVYSEGEPDTPNITINTNRATLKWNRFVAPSTPVPTGVGDCVDYNQGTRPANWSDVDDVGLFEGGGTYRKGIYRPVINCRMNGNAPPFCPVCYTVLKSKTDAKTKRTFLNCYVGDFNGGGKDDLLLHDGNSILIYRSQGQGLEHVFTAAGRIPGSPGGQMPGAWLISDSDRFYIGDFNRDGKDEVVVFNGSDWSTPYLGLLASDGAGGLQVIAIYADFIPGWQFSPGDQFYVADFDGDRRDDLYVFNRDNWATPCLGMLASFGIGFYLAKRYDGQIDGWTMRRQDRLHIGDFDGDGKVDFYLSNTSDWSMPYLAMMRSEGGSLTKVHQYNGTLPNWPMSPTDRFYVGDFSGNGRADLYIFNGANWKIPYLGMYVSTGTSLNFANRYDGVVPGWQMRKGDKHYVANFNGKDGLFVFNWTDWSFKYLGAMVSGGETLTASWNQDFVGEWPLSGQDRFDVCDYEGTGQRRDLFIHNRDWFGMIRATPSLALDQIYYRWIHNYRHGRNW